MFYISAQDKTLYDEGYLSLDGILKAYHAKDPRLAEYVVKLAMLDPMPEAEKDIANAAVKPITYAEFRIQYYHDSINKDILEQVEPLFRVEKQRPHQLIRQKKAQLFTERFEHFIKHPELVPERLKLGEFILLLYEDQSQYAKAQLRQIVAEVPLKWGPWQAFKSLLKYSTIDQRWDIFAISYNRWNDIYPLLRGGKKKRGRFPEELLPIDLAEIKWNAWSTIYALRERAQKNEITTGTHKFISRYLDALFARNFEQLSEIQREDIVAEVLVVVDSFRWQDCWCQWAHNLTWTSRHEPLLKVFLNAHNPDIIDWAFKLLQANHKEALRHLPSDWIVSQALSPMASDKVKSFIVKWFLEPLTPIQKSDFIEHGLHKAVLAFIDQWNRSGPYDNSAVRYACDFVRQFMEELSDYFDLNKIIWALRHSNDDIFNLGFYFLFPDGEKTSPFSEELDLAFWTQFLGDKRMHSYAQEAIQNKFSTDEISEDWLRARLLDKERKVVQLAQDWIDRGYHHPDIDFYGLYCENAFGQPGYYSLFDWAWAALNKMDVHGRALVDRFTATEYQKFLVSSNNKLRQLAYDAYKNEKVTAQDFSIDLLKSFIHQDEYAQVNWNDFFGETISSTSRLSSDQKKFAHTALNSHPDYTAEKLGYTWILERRNHSGADYQRVREIFQDSYPLSQLLLLDAERERGDIEDSEDNRGLGLQQVVKIIDNELDAQSTTTQFWHQFILNRLGRYRSLHEQEPLAEGCEIPASTFSLAWFSEQVRSQKDSQLSHRLFALNIAELYLSEWVDSAGEAGQFGYIELGAFLFSDYADVSEFFWKAIENQHTKHAFIDIRKPYFKAEDVYSYCFSSHAVARAGGMRLILSNREQLAQPDMLMLLANSPDQVVRGMVTEVLWELSHIPLVTANWQPTEASVIRVEPSQAKKGRHRLQVERSKPDYNKPILSNVKNLGEGTGERIEIRLSSYDLLVDFAYRELFRLPRAPRTAKNKDPNQPKLIPSWKSKRRLMESFRDLALQDRQFAIAIIPVFQELVLYKGQNVRNMAISALARIETFYADEPIPNLTFLADHEEPTEGL